MKIDSIYKMITSYDEELYNLGLTLFQRNVNMKILLQFGICIYNNIILSGMGNRLDQMEKSINLRDATKWREYEKRHGENPKDGRQ